MSLLPFFRWLASTPWSVSLHESLWVYPLVESTHVWSLALFFGFTALLDLRLVGLSMRRVPVSEVVHRLIPWMIAGFSLMVVTGILLLYAIPVRTYQSVFFRLKLSLIVLAGVNAFVFHYGVFRRVAEWDRDPILPKAARRAGAFSLALWVAVIFAGRLTAYNWFDCDRQPQPAIVNWAAGCVLESK